MRTRIENKSIYQDLNISHETDEVQVSVDDLKESIENVLKYIQVRLIMIYTISFLHAYYMYIHKFSEYAWVFCIF